MSECKEWLSWIEKYCEHLYIVERDGQIFQAMTWIDDHDKVHTTEGQSLIDCVTKAMEETEC